MTNRAKINQEQVQFFEQIKKSIPANQSFVDVISELLGVGIEACYRRIRGAKLLDLEETIKLCRHFHISLDTICGISDNTRRFDCIYRPIDLSILPNYYTYLHRLEKLGAGDNVNATLSASDIPVFHLISHKELTLFKLYTWSQSVYGYKGSLDDFMKEIDTAELTDCFQKIKKGYEEVPSSEIWTENTINTTLRLINYYYEIGCFSNKTFPLAICEQVREILSKLQKWAENGVKSERSTSFQLYFCEMEVENSFLLLKQSGKISNCVVKLFTINSLNIFDEDFCRETDRWLTKLLQRSVLLCGSSEKERIKFFNSQYEKVNILIDTIASS